MKKFLTILLSVLAVVLLIPLVLGMVNNPETDELNDAARANLPDDFMELPDGWTHYELSGPDNDETIVLIHGNSSPCFSFDHNAEALADAGFRVLRYDIFGHGFSDRPQTDFDHNLYDRQLMDLLDALEIDGPVHLLGTSQGGAVAVCFAARHPERTGKIGLMAPLMDEFVGMKMAALLKSPAGGYMKTAFFDTMNLKSCSGYFSSDSLTDEFTEKYKQQMRFKGWKRAKLSNIRNMDLDVIRDSYGVIAAREESVLLTWGTEDKSIPKDSIDRMRNVLPGIEYREIEGAGHLAHYEKPGILNPILTAFFSGR